MVEFFDAVKAFGVAEYVEYNPAVIRGLDYYTGTVFEGRDAAGEFRALLGGGRYDNLVADVGGEKISGVGFAMGDVVIGLILKNFGKEPKLRTAPAEVLVTTFSAEEAAASMELSAIAAGGGDRGGMVSRAGPAAQTVEICRCPGNSDGSHPGAG